MAFSTVRLVNAVFYAHHGVMQEEHRIGGRYEVDVAMDLDFEEAAKEEAEGIGASEKMRVGQVSPVVEQRGTVLAAG